MSKKKVGLIIVGVAILLAAGIFWFQKSQRSEDVSYEEFQVKRKDLELRIQSTGLVSPQNRLEIKPPVAGRIEEVLVSEGDKVKKGKIIAWISSSERAALLDAVRTQGAAELKKWEELYKPTPVIAPIDGTIILRNVEAGQSFINTDSIFTMADRLTVKAQVDETDIAQVKHGQLALITLDAYPSDPVEGKVVHLAYDATVTNNVTTYEVDVLPNKVPDFMRSGMTSNVNITVARKENVIQIPVSALVTPPGSKGVLIKNGEKQTFAEVETGLEDGKMIEVTRGLSGGETILIKSLDQKKSSASSNPFFPSRPKGARGGRR